MIRDSVVFCVDGFTTYGRGTSHSTTLLVEHRICGKAALYADRQSALAQDAYHADGTILAQRSNDAVWRIGFSILKPSKG